MYLIKFVENTYFFILVVEIFMTRVEKHFPLPLTSNISLFKKKKKADKDPFFFFKVEWTLGRFLPLTVTSIADTLK